MRRLNSDISSVMDWFKVNHLVANPDKFQMMILGLKNTDLTSIPNIHINGIIINPKDSVKLLGITLDKALTFQEHINNICITANRNLRCLSRLRPFLSVDQAKLLYNAYIKSIFAYCPLVWMFCYKSSYLKIKKVQKRSLRIVYNSYSLDLCELLEKEASDSFHIMHLKFLLVEIFKTLNDLNPSFMKKLFVRKEMPFNLRVSNVLSLPNTRTIRYGTNSVFFRGSLAWNALPDAIKTSETVPLFKNKLSALGSLSCNCKLCK